MLRRAKYYFFCHKWCVCVGEVGGREVVPFRLSSGFLQYYRSSPKGGGMGSMEPQEPTPLNLPLVSFSKGCHTYNRGQLKWAPHKSYILWNRLYWCMCVHVCVYVCIYVAIVLKWRSSMVHMQVSLSLSINWPICGIVCRLCSKCRSNFTVSIDNRGNNSILPLYYDLCCEPRLVHHLDALHHSCIITCYEWGRMH